MIYNSYIAPNNVTSDSHFLRYDFTEKMLDALGIKDSTGVIYELINYRYFTEDVLGTWDLMIDGMVNVRQLLNKIITHLNMSSWLGRSSSKPPPTSS